MRVRPIRLLLLLALLALAVTVLVNKCGRDATSAPQPGMAAMGPLSVSAVIVQPRHMTDRINAMGSLLANNSVELRNEVAGRLVAIHFEEGRPVARGALLVKIYDDDLQARLRKLKLDEETAARSEQREKELLAVNGISQQEYDLSLNALNGLRAEIDVLNAQIAKTEIRAPFAGVVGLRAVSEGAYLQANTLIATLQQLDPMKLDFTVPERYRDRLHVGDTISFSTDPGDGMHLGRIYAFEPMVDVRTRSLKIRALCANPDGGLLPGSFVKVTVPLSAILDALMVPAQAVIPELRGQRLLLCRGGRAVGAAIGTGLRTDSLVQVTSGLRAGDTVLITGIMQARPDVPLNVTVVNTGQAGGP